MKLVSLKKVNLEPLSTLANLERLTLRLHPNYIQRFHFGSLKKLRELDIDWNQGFDGVWQSSVLETLKIDGLRKVETVDVSLMKCLRSLSIQNSRTVQRLSMGQVRNLQKLSLISLPGLRSILGDHFRDSVTHLSAAGLKNLDPKYFLVFRALQIVEVGMQDRFTRQNLSCVPEHFLKLA